MDPPRPSSGFPFEAGGRGSQCRWIHISPLPKSEEHGSMGGDQDVRYGSRAPGHRQHGDCKEDTADSGEGVPVLCRV